MKRFALLACTLSISSCTIVDLGGAVDNVGREIPVSHDLAMPFKKHRKTTYPLYTMADGKRYIELDVRYLPARAKWFNCYMVGGCPVEAYERFDILYLSPTKTYYAEIEGEGPYTVTRLIAADEFTPTGATVGKIAFSEVEAHMAITAHLPEHRSTLNTVVQPIRWAAEVADIPLSFIATPINWLVLPTGYSLWTL